ncbi:aminotransferase class I/II-fold pyridoxal phosphate-dependent enzyme [Fictibacillus phosphorivorans]|uniref:aminotransferase class I/II-fold pyridoxal phosphate-dependent enzyme n=1 Tax=Fictibacillus phosphorivorans TaxID=1221500 RepID=UPI001293D812|nr:aminotransferase class I/II-fold pyridoxal phosphate-dependent enzyme [Fictibacillus phosphorivorans]MQR93931.1 aminotransferase class I/II-fold pyridoxal phosphate-dependent enzyme [Fictibacillus phosphorivorans]
MKHAPLYEALINHSHTNKWSFHVPGHKNGHIFEERAKDTFQSVLPFDVTELSGLDDLHHPEGVILEAQQLLGDYYRVKHSFFLVNGSTCGNHAMILSSFNDEDIVFVQRNCHKSVLNGLELAGVTPVFLHTEMDEEGGYPLGVHLQTVKEAVERYPHVKGIILTNPTYYGMQQDIQDIADLIHSVGGVVLVDEAHGAHFGLKDMPISSIHKGADMVVQSAHKTLPALTMGAYLHVNSERVDIHRLKHALQLVQSSSPSYLIMASLDLSRLYLENMSNDDINRILSQAEGMRKYIDSLPHLKVIKAPDRYQIDPLKITVQSDRELSGYELQALFEKEGLFTELADDRNVLFVLPLGTVNDSTDLQRVLKKVSDQLSRYVRRQQTEQSLTDVLQVSRLSLSYREMRGLQAKPQSIMDSEGQIAAEAVIPYPPGIPLVAKGEQITSKHIDEYSLLKKKGARFQGITEDHLIYVFDHR